MSAAPPLIKPTPRSARKDRDGLHRRDGIWYFGWRDPFTNKWREISTGTRSFAEAKKVRAEKIRELIEKNYQTVTTKIRVASAYERWVEDAKVRYSKSSMRLYTERSKPVLKHLGEVWLQKIGIDTVRKYQQIRAEEVSPRTVNLEMQLLRNVLKHFHLWRGQLREEYVPLPERRSGVGRVLSPEQEMRVLGVARSSIHFSRTYYIWQLFTNTGARGNEILKARIGDIDLDKRQIHVSSKTSAGDRIVPLNDHAFIAIRQLLQAAREKGAHLPEHYLFPAALYARRRPGESSSGYDPTSPQKTIRTAWRHFTRACGLKGLRIHDRRHQFITVMAEQDVPVESARAIVGHMSNEMLRHYTHIRDTAKRAAVERVASTNVVAVQELTERLPQTRRRRKPRGETTKAEGNNA